MFSSMIVVTATKFLAIDNYNRISIQIDWNVPLKKKKKKDKISYQEEVWLH